jgi:hypothetical protein
MSIAVFQLLSQGSSDLLRTGGLEFDDFQKLRNTGEVIFFVCLGGQLLDMDGDGGKGLLLFVVFITGY